MSSLSWYVSKCQTAGNSDCVAATQEVPGGPVLDLSACPAGTNLCLPVCQSHCTVTATCLTPSVFPTCMPITHASHHLPQKQHALTPPQASSQMPQNRGLKESLGGMVKREDGIGKMPTGDGVIRVRGNWDIGANNTLLWDTVTGNNHKQLYKSFQSCLSLQC